MLSGLGEATFIAPLVSKSLVGLVLVMIFIHPECNYDHSNSYSSLSGHQVEPEWPDTVAQQGSRPVWQGTGPMFTLSLHYGFRC